MTLDCTCNRLAEAERKAALWDGIVRCGECEHSRRKGEKCYRVMTHDIFGNPKPMDVKPDGYCHRGERREDA